MDPRAGRAAWAWPDVVAADHWKVVPPNRSETPFPVIWWGPSTVKA
jgi:hypothetical protein